MAITTRRFTALVTATTAASGATNKVAALVTGLQDAIIGEIFKAGHFPVNGQQRAAQLRAELAANVASFQTALGL